MNVELDCSWVYQHPRENHAEPSSEEAASRRCERLNEDSPRANTVVFIEEGCELHLRTILFGDGYSVMPPRFIGNQRVTDSYMFHE